MQLDHPGQLHNLNLFDSICSNQKKHLWGKPLGVSFHVRGIHSGRPRSVSRGIVMGIDQRPLDALRHLVLERLVKIPMERVHGKDRLDDRVRKFCMMLSCLVIESSIYHLFGLCISPVLLGHWRGSGESDDHVPADSGRQVSFC